MWEGYLMEKEGMEEVNTIQGPVRCFNMVGFAQWKWQFCLPNKNSDLGFTGIWKHGWIGLG